MDFSLFGYDFSIGFLDYFVTNAAISFTILLSVILAEYEQKGKFESGDSFSEMVFIILLLTAVGGLALPIAAVVLSGAWIIHEDCRDAVSEYFSLLYKFFFVRLGDYIAIFLPVACVLSLFLLD